MPQLNQQKKVRGNERLPLTTGIQNAASTRFPAVAFAPLTYPRSQPTSVSHLLCFSAEGRA